MVSRPRAADDFDAIRRRMAELREKKVRALNSGDDPSRPPRPYQLSMRGEKLALREFLCRQDPLRAFCPLAGPEKEFLKIFCPDRCRQKAGGSGSAAP
jgi:hypothetical protein